MASAEPYSLRKVISVLSGLTLCGILVAGLWPFHSPKNQVRWLTNQNSLTFGRYGTVLSPGLLESASWDGPSCSLEIWLEPASPWKTGTVVAFYNPSTHRQFSLQQDYTDLALERDIGVEYQQTNLIIDEAFRREQVFIIVTSDGRETAVYIDGNLVTRSLRFGLTLQDLTGKLILANSPLQGNSWPGRLRGLAIFKSELTAEEVGQHYRDWTKKGKPNVNDDERAVALYLFDEHTGNTIHNQVGSGIDLYIPARYLVVDQILLEPPWKEFHRQRNYLKNVLINVAGFIPLGFCFGAYFTSVRQVKHDILATIVFGAIVSLTIEVLQAHLPTRDSGVTDLMTNTFGTAIGVTLHRAAVLLPTQALAPRHWVRSKL
jgi:VanZ family protein